MLRVTNGAVTVTVTKGAFESYFKHAGFTVLNGVNSPESEGVGKYHPIPDSPKDEDENQTEEDEEDYTDEFRNEEESEESEESAIDYSEIPLSELGFDELSDYADQLGIDHRGVRSKRELRTAIREYLRQK